MNGGEMELFWTEYMVVNRLPTSEIRAARPGCRAVLERDTPGNNVVPPGA
jgi:hypothetical protein